MIGIFFISSRSWVINKNVKNEFVETFANNSRSKQNQKKSECPFVDIGMKETCAKFQQKVLNLWSLELVKIFKTKTWFLENFV